MVGSPACRSVWGPDVIEIKDVVGWAIGSVGWLLAGYQFVRNELTKRPYVVFQTSPPVAGALAWGGTFVVRNRGPWDIKVNCIRIVRPKGAMLDEPRSVGAEVVMEKVRERRYGWRIPAHASGDFPSKTDWFKVTFPAGVSGRVELQVEIDISRETWLSSRFTTRHKTKTVNK